MTAHKYIILSTDALAPNPYFRSIDIDPYIEEEDIEFCAITRYWGIRKRYPNARFEKVSGRHWRVLITDYVVFEMKVLAQIAEPIEIDESELEGIE